jgi:hypothetical protein
MDTNGVSILVSYILFDSRDWRRLKGIKTAEQKLKYPQGMVPMQ